MNNFTNTSNLGLQSSSPANSFIGPINPSSKNTSPSLTGMGDAMSQFKTQKPTQSPDLLSHLKTQIPEARHSLPPDKMQEIASIIRKMQGDGRSYDSIKKVVAEYNNRYNSEQTKLSVREARQKAIDEQRAANPEIQPIETDTRMKGIKQGVMNNIMPTGKEVVEGVKTYGKNVWNDYNEAGKNIVKNIQTMGNTPEAGVDQPLTAKGTAAVLRMVLRNSSETVNAVFAPVTELLRPLIQNDAKWLSENPHFSELATSKLGNAIDSVQQKANALAEKNPELAKDLNDVFTVLMGVAGTNPANKTGEFIVGKTKNVKTGIGNAVNSVSEAMPKFIDDVKTSASEVGSNIKQNATAMIDDVKAVRDGRLDVKTNDLTGKVLQGTKDDISAGRDALSNIDITAVKTAPVGKAYDTLYNILKEKASQVYETKIKALETNKTVTKLDDLTVEAGNKPHNFVKDALDQLETFYKKTNDPAGESAIQSLRTKAQTKGLTVAELDRLASEHGNTIKAFNANGEAATGLAKQAAENTRTGVKNTAKKIFGDDAYTNADRYSSSLINTRNAIEKVSESVNKMFQKVEDKGWVRATGGWIGSKVGAAIDATTGGTLKAVINHFVKNAIDVSLDAKGLDAQLYKVLEKIQKATKSTTEQDFMDSVTKIMSENKSKPVVVPGVKAPIDTQIIRPSDLKYNGKLDQGMIKVNDYRSKFPKYFTPEQITRATELLKAKEQAGHTIDMKSIDAIVKKVVSMTDIKKK